MNKPLTFLLSLTFLFLFSGSVYGEGPEVKREYWDNGNLKKETHYKNGKENGLHAEWRWDNGEKLMEANFKDGDLHGLYKDWHSNGVQANIGQYKEGKEDGLWVLWSKDGSRQSKKIYKNGNEQ
jgi:antitoxin component YwqK of YwqJK toxin-antitoxin module